MPSASVLRPRLGPSRGARSLVAALAALGAGCVAPDLPPPTTPSTGVATPPSPVTAAAPAYLVPPPATTSAPYQTGLATWYGSALAGHRTATGERFDPGALTAAHRTLPLGTWVEVRRPDTGRWVRVRINDRGPFGDPRRVIDLSRAAADALDLRKLGVGRVELRVVPPP